MEEGLAGLLICAFKEVAAGGWEDRAEMAYRFANARSGHLEDQMMLEPVAVGLHPLGQMAWEEAAQPLEQLVAAPKPLLQSEHPRQPLRAKILNHEEGIFPVDSSDI